MHLLRTLSSLARDSATVAEGLRRASKDPEADLRFRIAEAADMLHGLLIEEAVGQAVVLEIGGGRDRSMRVGGGVA